MTSKEITVTLPFCKTFEHFHLISKNFGRVFLSKNIPNTFVRIWDFERKKRIVRHIGSFIETLWSDNIYIRILSLHCYSRSPFGKRPSVLDLFETHLLLLV